MEGSSSGWDAFRDEISDEDVEWELVIDNNSGTYSPSPTLLPTLKSLLEFNFPGLNVVTYDHSDPELGKSTEACRRYAVERRGVRREELAPCVQVGEETLLSRAVSCKGGKDKGRGRGKGKDGVVKGDDVAADNVGDAAVAAAVAGQEEEAMEGMPVQAGMGLPEEVELEEPLLGRPVT